MTSQTLSRFILLFILLGFSAWSAPGSFADSRHARIIRVSYLQGDVRFLRESAGNPLADAKATWERAALNLPIRQGNVLATDEGRAEVEFENGTLAFLKEHTVVEFYDLTLRDGFHTTRLILRQGTASFRTLLAGDDYFSVTGGDFTVEAEGNCRFRMDDYDDGTALLALKGMVTVLRKEVSSRVANGQSFSVKAGDDSAAVTGAVPEQDEFDRWALNRVDRATTATNNTLPYTSSPYYAAGFATLSSYGAWSSCGSFGYGWRPFGASLGWSPFSDGQWIWDPAYGWTFLGAQPWGWAPYHYGGWLFDASCGGWFYSPPVYFRNPPSIFGPRKRSPLPIHPPRPIYQPATAVFVKQGGKIGVVPMHPADAPGKTPKNLDHGVFSISPSGAGNERLVSSEPGKKWGTLKFPPRNVMENSLIRVEQPVRSSRSMPEAKAGSAVNAWGKDSSITYDGKEHRYVNSNRTAGQTNIQEKIPVAEKSAIHPAQSPTGNGTTRAGETPGSVTRGDQRSSVPQPPSISRATATPRPSRVIVPPPAPRTAVGGRSRSGNSDRGGAPSGGNNAGRFSSSGSAGSSSHSSGGSAHPSGRPH